MRDLSRDILDFFRFQVTEKLPQG